MSKNLNSGVDLNSLQRDVVGGAIDALQGTAPGVKLDQGKLRYDLLPWKAIEGLVRVLSFGARKYTDNGWRTVPDAVPRYEAALLRHLSAIKRGESVDPESGLRHIDHILCNVSFLAELMEQDETAR